MKSTPAFPKRLKIGGHRFTIELVDLEEVRGDTDFATNVIRIDRQLNTSQREAALIHEIFHAINPTFDSESVGHSLLCSLSEQFYAALKENNLLNL